MWCDSVPNLTEIRVDIKRWRYILITFRLLTTGYCRYIFRRRLVSVDWVRPLMTTSSLVHACQADRVRYLWLSLEHCFILCQLTLHGWENALVWVRLHIACLTVSLELWWMVSGKGTWYLCLKLTLDCIWLMIICSGQVGLLNGHLFSTLPLSFNLFLPLLTFGHLTLLTIRWALPMDR